MFNSLLRRVLKEQCARRCICPLGCDRLTASSRPSSSRSAAKIFVQSPKASAPRGPVPDKRGGQRQFDMAQSQQKHSSGHRHSGGSRRRPESSASATSDSDPAPSASRINMEKIRGLRPHLFPDGGVAVQQLVGTRSDEPFPKQPETPAAGSGHNSKARVTRGLGVKDYEVASKYMREVPAFTQLSLDALQKVCEKLQIVKFAPHETIITKGEVGAAFYMIKAGCVEFYKGDTANKDGENLLGKRNEGEFFGEIALIADDNRATASANAASKGAECFVLKKRHFDLLLKRSMRDERQKKTGRFRYGEIDFEETGNRVPYMIIPNTDVRNCLAAGKHSGNCAAHVMRQHPPILSESLRTVRCDVRRGATPLKSSNTWSNT